MTKVPGRLQPTPPRLNAAPLLTHARALGTEKQRETRSLHAVLSSSQPSSSQSCSAVHLWGFSQQPGGDAVFAGAPLILRAFLRSLLSHLLISPLGSFSVIFFSPFLIKKDFFSDLFPSAVGAIRRDWRRFLLLTHVYDLAMDTHALGRTRTHVNAHADRRSRS